MSNPIADENINAGDLSFAAGTVPLQIADDNIDAGQYGWVNSGIHLLNGHSCFQDLGYPQVYGWWHRVFAVGAGVRIGQE